MAQVPCIGLYKPCTNLPFGICAIYFDLKVNRTRTKRSKQKQWKQSPQFSLNTENWALIQLAGILVWNHTKRNKWWIITICTRWIVRDLRGCWRGRLVWDPLCEFTGIHPKNLYNIMFPLADLHWWVLATTALTSALWSGTFTVLEDGPWHVS